MEAKFAKGRSKNPIRTRQQPRGREPDSRGRKTETDTPDPTRERRNANTTSTDHVWAEVEGIEIRGGQLGKDPQKLENYARVPPGIFLQRDGSKPSPKKPGPGNGRMGAINRAQTRTPKRDQENSNANRIAREAASRSRARFPCEGCMRCAARS